jgi:hypothetical protein
VSGEGLPSFITEKVASGSLSPTLMVMFWSPRNGSGLFAREPLIRFRAQRQPVL